MIVHINESAEAIVKRLFESGEFPSVDSVVNSIILMAYPCPPVEESARQRIPDAIFDGAEFVPNTDLPRRSTHPLAIASETRRLPELLEGP